jgi:hypothetical protein
MHTLPTFDSDLLLAITLKQARLPARVGASMSAFKDLVTLSPTKGFGKLVARSKKLH